MRSGLRFAPLGEREGEGFKQCVAGHRKGDLNLGGPGSDALHRYLDILAFPGGVHRSASSHVPAHRRLDNLGVRDLYLRRTQLHEIFSCSQGVVVEHSECGRLLRRFQNDLLARTRGGGHPLRLVLALEQDHRCPRNIGLHVQLPVQPAADLAEGQRRPLLERPGEVQGAARGAGLHAAEAHPLRARARAVVGQGLLGPLQAGADHA
mmetsp:Transcript_58889/g.151426  ORF Transcript_58889/g.151426 Transcript_58889/m.151426 type:complete len:207 (-) Transcript_58889:904-1524(-)